MGTTMRAKMQVSMVQEHYMYDPEPSARSEKSGETLHMNAVCKPSYTDSEFDEDNTYARMSPGATLSINVANPALWDQFKHGDKFYVDFTPVDAVVNVAPPEYTSAFQGALAALKDGRRVARAGWNGKGMFLFLVPGSTFKVNRAPLLGIYPEGHEVNYHPHIDMKTADGTIVPWLASQTDLLAEDWHVLD